MTYIKPPWFTRKIFNPLSMMTGFGSDATLITRGRRTGEPRRIPVIPVEFNGARYLVAPRGETDWVRNIRAAGGAAELQRKGQTQAIAATEIAVSERAPVIEIYRKKAGSAVAAYWKALPDDADHPVFRIEPRAGAGV
jgi:deazaflavin-dependent oxidoreductase (nitroreductase family)